MSRSKAVIVTAITICLMISVAEIVSGIKRHTPPYKVGECFVVYNDTMGLMKFQVLQNDIGRQITHAVVRINYDLAPTAYVSVLDFPITGTFDEVRQMNALKAECE